MNAFESKKEKVLMIRMNETEALATIRSLIEQLISHNPNVGRYEKYLEDGRDFSIAVEFEEDSSRIEELEAELRLVGRTSA